jgi:hypothetical protein
MSIRSSCVAAAVATAALVAPGSALAAWSTPTTVYAGDTANPLAVPLAPGGGVLLGGFIDSEVRIAGRDGDHVGAAQSIYTPVPFERLWVSGADAAGDVTILTIRRHKPYQRVRAVLRRHDGTVTAPRTISAKGHSAAQPSLAVAPDGSAVAAWAWHDKPGWRVQAAVRPPGGDFGPAVTLSDPDRTRPWIDIAVGKGGAAAVSWHFGGSYAQPNEPLFVASAAAGGTFGAAQKYTDAGDFANTALAVGDDGHVAVAYSPTYYYENDKAPGPLLLAEGQAGTPLGASSKLADGGPGVISGPMVGAAYTGAGDLVVGWIARTGANEEAGRVELYVRPQGASAFVPAQTPAGPDVNPVGIVVAGGPDGRAVAAWYEHPKDTKYPNLSIHATVRGAAGGAFGEPVRVNPDGETGLWPTAAIAPNGDTVVTWTHNSDGSGGGSVEASVLPAG